MSVAIRLHKINFPKIEKSLLMYKNQKNISPRAFLNNGYTLKNGAKE